MTDTIGLAAKGLRSLFNRTPVPFVSRTGSLLRGFGDYGRRAAHHWPKVRRRRARVPRSWLITST